MVTNILQIFLYATKLEKLGNILQFSTKLNNWSQRILSNECIGEGASQIRHTWYMTQNRKSPTRLYWKEEEEK